MGRKLCCRVKVVRRRDGRRGTMIVVKGECIILRYFGFMNTLYVGMLEGELWWRAGGWIRVIKKSWVYESEGSVGGDWVEGEEWGWGGVIVEVR